LWGRAVHRPLLRFEVKARNAAHIAPALYASGSNSSTGTPEMCAIMTG
jgi:hypothetical protein